MASELSVDHWDWGYKADALRRRRRWKEAITSYNKALQLNPLDTVSRDAYLSDLNGKQECLLKLGRLAEASRCAEEENGLRASSRVTKKRSPESLSNPRLLRAIAALGLDQGPSRRGEFTKALLKSMLLFEENPRSKSGFHHRTESGLIELFTDLEAYRLWRPRTPAGRRLSVREATDLLGQIIALRADGVIINAGGPATVELSCKGSAAIHLLDRYPIFWI